MVLTNFILLAYALASPQEQFIAAQHTGHGVWREDEEDFLRPGYHPILRLYGESKFLFASPWQIVDGHYNVKDRVVSFTPELVTELNHADFDKLLSEAPPVARQRFDHDYTLEMRVFHGTLSDDGSTVDLEYAPDPSLGAMHYKIMAFEALGANRADQTGDSDRQFVGLWYSPEPNPERLDSKDRYRIEGVDGLKRFASEAMASSENQFAVLDLRRDHSGLTPTSSREARWRREEAILKVGEVRYTFSPDFKTLYLNGKVAYLKG